MAEWIRAQPGGGIAIVDFVEYLKQDQLTSIHLQRDTVRKVPGYSSVDSRFFVSDFLAS